MLHISFYFTPPRVQVHVIKDTYISFSYRSSLSLLLLTTVQRLSAPVECFSAFQTSVNWLFTDPPSYSNLHFHSGPFKDSIVGMEFSSYSQILAEP